VLAHGQAAHAGADDDHPLRLHGNGRQEAKLDASACWACGDRSGRIPEERVVLWGGTALRNEVDLLFGFQGPSNCRSVGVHLALMSKTESSSSNRYTREREITVGYR
jgi:hypothetical protein